LNYTRIIKWLSKQPGPYALGLLFWSEITIYACSLAGGWLLTRFLVETVTPLRPMPIFIAVLIIYFVVFYLIHLVFSHNSRFFEGLINIHRYGGPDRIARLYNEEKQALHDKGDESAGSIEDPFSPPVKIRASAENFKLRYFLILPAALVLYFLSFASTIYRLFARQVFTWDFGMLMLIALLLAALSSVCFWSMMPLLPGYVGVRKLFGKSTSEGE